jgi:hypothetical protein
MAAQSPRSLINIVFMLLLAAALVGAGILTLDMFQSALSGPG